ncbi:uncharacterized protein DS421_5g137980 [Arachis hypogaea]|nr:uncharacterized protein DS421_5g137980 [Arachis hypogaea]
MNGTLSFTEHEIKDIDILTAFRVILHLGVLAKKAGTAAESFTGTWIMFYITAKKHINHFLCFFFLNIAFVQL